MTTPDEGIVELVAFRSTRWGTNRTATPEWRRLRLLILKRDGAICRYCGRPGATTVDHVVPVFRGGTDDPNNLVAACESCHRRKTSREAHSAKQPRKRAPEKHPGFIA